MSQEQFIQALKERRSIYSLGRNVPFTEDEIADFIKEVVRLSPTAFNSQTQRVAILFGKHHEKVWEIAKAALKPLTPKEAFPSTQKKIESFKNAFGTILLFEDQDIVKSLQNQFALYAENFPIWSEQAHGLTASNIWTGLSTKGLGANLQHYNPLIDEEVAKEWNIPAHWKLRGQIVFGSKEAEAPEKEFMNDDERFKVVK